ncbi:unnamed protein product [Prorocentrum cordatum]|uniref:Uncharacterized protein n=1 Tax=Prorocentrum cordatum TaxID=2364126 RepID=A0ABN9UU80_9DINO|nr:unnamed protein product [Polarella glacialis]
MAAGLAAVAPAGRLLDFRDRRLTREVVGLGVALASPGAAGTPKALALASGGASPAAASAGAAAGAAGLAASIEARGRALQAHELQRASRAPAGAPAAAAAPTPEPAREEGGGDVPELHEAPRPPEGSGYAYPTYVGPLLPTLSERLGHAPVGGRPEAAAPASARRQRIEALERGMRAYEEERLLRLASGTAPLLGPGGQPLLPVPPPEAHGPRLGLQTRLHLLSTARSQSST